MLSKETYLQTKKFNMHRQEEEEPVDSFITPLYRLAEHCNYHDLHYEIRLLWAYNIQIYQRDYKLIQN